MNQLVTVWDNPDEGIWEIRGTSRHFTHSKVMAWVALDRAIQSVERFGLEGPLNQWRTTRQEIHDQVCRRGFNSELGSFVQAYGSRELDASLLLLPLTGFLPPTDSRIWGTIAAIERRLVVDPASVFSGGPGEHSSQFEPQDEACRTTQQNANAVRGAVLSTPG